MKRKLKTWKAFEDEFEPLSDEWYEDGFGDYYITYKNMHWIIIPEMRRIFGSEIEFYKIDNEDYTYKGKEYSYLWHELWFEPEYKEIEFLSEKEVII